MNDKVKCCHTMPGVTGEIRRRMKEKKISCMKMAKKLGETYQHTYRMLTGRSPLYLDEVVVIADALGVSVDELVRGGKELEE